MATLDLSSFDQPTGSTSDGTKYDNALTAIQTTINSLDNANIASAAGITLSKLGQSGAVTNQVPVWNGSAWAPGPGALYRKTTAKAVNTTTTETDLLNGEITVAANVLGSTGMLRLTARGDWLQNTGGATDVPRLKLKLGGTTLLDIGAISANVAGASASRLPWAIDATIANLGATNSQWATLLGWHVITASGTLGGAGCSTGEGGVGTLVTSGTSANRVSYEAANSGAVDTTASCALVLSVINAVSSANYEVALKHALVEVL